MLRWQIILILSLLSITCQAQKLVWKKEYYDKEKKQIKRQFQVLETKPRVANGQAIVYFQSGVVKSRGNYQESKPEGEWQFYYESGALQQEIIYKAGVQLGNFKQYFENGKLAKTGNIENVKRQGKWKTFYENGNLKSVGYYDKGKQVGTWIFYYETGKLKSENFFSGEASWYIEYHDNGSIKMEGKMVNGVSDSLWTYYHENGEIQSIGYEKNGLKEGKWKFFFESGTAKSEGNFTSGEPNGKWTYFHENSGAIASEGEYKEGQQDGNWRLFFENGQVQGEATYTKGAGEYKEFYDNGKLKVKGNYKNGVQSGQWLYFDEDGTKEGICNYENGVGEYIGFYPDGKIKTTGTLDKGVKTGTWSLFDQQGKLTGTFFSYKEGAVGKPTIVNQPIKDSTKQTTVKPSSGNLNSLRKKHPFYLIPRNNEHWKLIVATNPFGFVANQIPISFEYYIPNRVGLEAFITLHRNPIFGNFGNPLPNATYSKGYSISLRNKLYEKDRGYGSIYLAAGARYAYFEHQYTYQNSLDPTSLKVTYMGTEERYEITGLAGWRIDRNVTTTHKISFDLFLGVGFGYKNLKLQNYQYFNDLNKNKNYFPIRLGGTIGYLF